jgi:hypothetical protein
MKISFITVIFHLVLLLTIAATPSFALGSNPDSVQQSPVPQAPPPIPEFLMNSVPPVEKTAPGMYKMGEIVINKKERSVSFPALVNQQDGLLEYLVVHARGKVHESLFKTKVEPYYLNLALLLLEFEGTDRPLRFQGDPAVPHGDPLSITVSYVTKDDKKVSAVPEKWIVLKKYNDPSYREDVGVLKWVYTGARVWNGRFAAQTGGSIVAVYHDPDAMIDNASLGAESDKIWHVNAKTAPPLGTPVTITIRAAK